MVCWPSKLHHPLISITLDWPKHVKPAHVLLLGGAVRKMETVNVWSVIIHALASPFRRDQLPLNKQGMRCSHKASLSYSRAVLRSQLVVQPNSFAPRRSKTLGTTCHCCWLFVGSLEGVNPKVFIQDAEITVGWYGRLYYSIGFK